MPLRSTRLVATLATVVLLLVVGCLGGTGPPASPPTTTAPDDPAPDGPGSDGAATDEPQPDWFCPATEPQGDLPTSRGGFELTVDRTALEAGEDIRVSLTNRADEEQATGNRRHYVLQRRVGDEWVAVSGAPTDGGGLNATAHPHAPGEGFTWEFSASVEGFSRNGYHVCGSLPADEYRFVYTGLVHTGDVAVRFDYYG